VAKPKSRTARWYQAVSDAQEALEKARSAGDELSQALINLQEIQSEYQEWQDSLPENLQQSPVGEKLQAVLDIDIESVMGEPLENWADTENAIGEAENVELPQGFGRD